MEVVSTREEVSMMVQQFLCVSLLPSVPRRTSLVMAMTNGKRLGGACSMLSFALVTRVDSYKLFLLLRISFGGEGSVFCSRRTASRLLVAKGTFFGVRSPIVSLVHTWDLWDVSVYAVRDFLQGPTAASNVSLLR